MAHLSGAIENLVRPGAVAYFGQKWPLEKFKREAILLSITTYSEASALRF